MLADKGRLGEVRRTDGGHRRVRASTVDACIEQQKGVLGEVASPRQAAIKAGLYERSDSAYTNVVGDRAKSAAPRKVATTKSRNARK